MEGRRWVGRRGICGVYVCMGDEWVYLRMWRLNQTVSCVHFCRSGD
jgi:hypothetical protein